MTEVKKHLGLVRKKMNQTLVMSTQIMTFQVALSSTPGSVSVSAMSKDTTP